MAKYLLIQTAFIGDVILSTVLIETIKKNDSEATIDFILKKGNEELLSSNPHLNKVLCFDKKKKLSSFLRLVRQIRQNNYDFTINIHRFFSSGALAFFSKSKVKIGYKQNPFSRFYNHSVHHQIGEGIHEVDRVLSLVSTLNFNKIRIPKLYYSQENQLKIGPFIKNPYICLAPASVWNTKQAPIEKWVSILEKHSNKTVLFIGGKNDFGLVEKIIEQSGMKSENIQNLCGNLSLLESAALLSKAEQAYVNDSAPLHMCSANNTKVTVLYCSTSPSFGFGPLSDQSEILEVKNLPCKPCGIHGHKVCPKGHFKCGKDLVID